MPTVAIIGRPNAGKSTLFNALIGERRAIESSIAGTTRDRVFGNVSGKVISYLLVDTGGITGETENSIEKDVKAQAIASIEGADLIYFCIDIREDITAEEHEIISLLRKKKPKRVPLFLLATKSEKMRYEDMLGDLAALGVADEIFFVSAQQHFGLYELRMATEESFIAHGFQKNEDKKEDDILARMCIVGKPNAGKSTLTNLLSGKEVSIVSPESGTTRDQIDSLVSYEKQKYLLIDTAGVLKKSQMNRKEIERYSRLRALSALHRADIALLLIDATEGITHQDQVLAQEIVDSGRGVILVFSKWDLARKQNRETILEEIKEKDRFQVEKTTADEKQKRVSKSATDMRARFLRQAQSRFPFLPWAPILFLSSVEKKGVKEIFETTAKLMEERKKEIPTSELNDFLVQALSLHPPASRGTKQLKVKYAVQIDTNPPAFAFFANDPDAAHFSFQRYLENRLREVYGFWGTPITIEIRKKSKKNPYDNR